MVRFIAKKIWKLRWNGRFFGKYNLPKIIQEEIDNLNILSSKEIMPNCFSHIQLFVTPWTRTLQARTLEWVAIPFSRRSGVKPRGKTQVSHLSGRFFLPVELPRKP